jgi:heme/copper-type cytochrome/quinol oxidase subunit 3
VSSVPRPFAAPDPARAAAERAARPNGWWGMLLLVAAEATLFGTLLASYAYLRFRTEPWPPHGIDPPSVLLPSLMTALLVATSVPMWLAARSVTRGRVPPALAALAVAFVTQVAYLAVQMHLFTDDLSRFTPQRDAYASIYFTLLGAHHAHVAVGLLLDVWLLWKLARGLTGYRLIATQGIALYWHFVNALGVVVTLVVLSPAL